MKALQMRQKIKLQGHIARTDPDLTGLHIRHLQHLVLAHLNLFIASFHIIIKYLTRRGQLHAFPVAHEKLRTKCLCKRTNRLTNCRLCDRKHLRGLCDAATFRRVVKKFVVFQIDIHWC